LEGVDLAEVLAGAFFEQLGVRGTKVISRDAWVWQLGTAARADSPQYGVSILSTLAGVFPRRWPRGQR
jgi:hypothetical protein